MQYRQRLTQSGRRSTGEHKKKVGHGKDDFFLQTRTKGEQIWITEELPEDLPKVELEFLSRGERSPVSAPGREQYRKAHRVEKRKDRPSKVSSSSESPPPKQL